MKTAGGLTDQLAGPSGGLSLSLRALLIFALVSLQAFAVLTTVSIIGFGTERALVRQSTQLLEESGARVGNEIARFLAPARQAVDLSADLVANGALDASDDAALESHIFRLLQIAPQQSGFYFGRTDGSFVMVLRSDQPGEFRTKIIDTVQAGARLIWRDEAYSPLRQSYDPLDAYDPRARPWYQDAAEAGRLVWTGPYVFFTSQRPGLTIARPVYVDGELVGVFGSDIEIGVLSSMLDEVQSQDTGAVMILTEAGRLIAHSHLPTSEAQDPFIQLTPSIDPVAAQAFVFDNGSFGPVRDVEGHVAILSGIEGWSLPWRVGLHAPKEAFTGEISRERGRWLWIVLIVVLLSALIAVYLANRIGRPVLAFAQASGLAARGDDGPARPLRAPYSELAGTSETLVQEIGKRRRFQAAYDRTFELSSRGMARVDPVSGRFLHANARLCDQFGQTPEGILDLCLSDIILSGDSSQLAAFYDAMHSDQECSIEARFRADGETVRWLRLTAILIRDEAGEADHALAIFDDIEESRRAREDLERLRRDLNHVGRVNAMGEFAGGLAHELNQPLAALTHDIDTARMVLDEEVPDRQELRAVLGDVEAHAMRAGDIIRALRNVVRKEKGNLTPFDLADLTRQTLTLLEPEARELGVRVINETRRGVLVLGNRTQIAQVLVNLLRNSFEAMGRAQSERQSVRITQTLEAGMVSLVIEDNGPGFPSGVQPFSKFTTTKETGLGLGLSISQTLVQANEGTIRYEAVAPHGARFIVRLPQTDTAAQQGQTV